MQTALKETKLSYKDWIKLFLIFFQPCPKGVCIFAICMILLDN